jgi:hypothetical protein
LKKKKYPIFLMTPVHINEYFIFSLPINALLTYHNA